MREIQHVTLRTVSRRSGVPVRILRQQERAASDLQLSELAVWAEALEVPITELLAEPADSLCGSVAQRAQLVRLMKTIEALRAHSPHGPLGRLADTLRLQLLELMPELSDITPWPKEGSRRPDGGLGRIACHPLSPTQADPPSGD